MKTGIIYHSYSGVTRGIVRKILAATEGSVIEVNPKDQYSSYTVVLKGCYRALKGSSDPITPSEIDVSGFDLVVIGSPVWAGRPTPVINGAVDALVGSSGKPVFLVVTCNDRKSGASAVLSLTHQCEKNGFVICGSAVLDKHMVRDENAVSNLISRIQAAGGQS